MLFDQQKFQEAMEKAGLAVRHIPWAETKAKLDEQGFIPRGVNPEGWHVGEETPVPRFRPVSRSRRRR